MFFLIKAENLLREHDCRMDVVPTDAKSLSKSYMIFLLRFGLTNSNNRVLCGGNI